MTALINAIRQALDAGPTAWEYDSNQTPFYNDSDGHSCGGDSDGTYSIYGPGFTIENEMYEGQVLSERCNETDAKYISACNPAAITELLAELDSLKIDAARHSTRLECGRDS